MQEQDQQSNGFANEPVAGKTIKNNNVVDSTDVKFEEKQDPTGQILESVINKNDTPQKESDENPISVIPEVASAVINNTENNGNPSSVIPEVVSSVVNNTTKPIEEPIKDTASAKVISNVVSDVINKSENNIGNEVVEPSNENPPNENINENINIEESDYDNEFYVYIIYYKDLQIPVVIGNKTNDEKLQFPIYMINNKEGVDRIGYFQFENEDGLYETDNKNLNASKLTSPIFYKNIDDTIKRKSDPKKYTNNGVSPLIVVEPDSKVELSSPINTWGSIKIDNPDFTYDLNNDNTQIDKTQLYKHKIPGDGNCFFTAVAQAFYTIDITTDANKLREFLYDKLDHNKNKDSYVDIKEYYQDLYKNCADKPECNLDCPHIKSFFGFDDSNKTYQKEFNDDTFINFFMSTDCWANEHLIKILSNILEITFLIHNSDYPNIDNLQNNPEKTYDHYILLEYNGNHYDLILQKTDDTTPTYKGIFTKDELTEEIKKYFSIN